MSGHTPSSAATDSEELQHIGAYLRELREHYRLSVQDVAKRLHIRPKYIEALEEGRIDELPGKVYTVGYLQSYTEFLGLDAQKILSEYQEIQKMDERETFRVIEPYHRQGAPALRLVVACLVLLLVAFVGWQIFVATSDDSPEQPVVEAVPEHMLEEANNNLTATRHNRECLRQDRHGFAYPPCYAAAEEKEAPMPFAPRPYGSMLELR